MLTDGPGQGRTERTEVADGPPDPRLTWWLSDGAGWAGPVPVSVRVPLDGCRGPAALAIDAGVAGVEPHPAVELVPTLPGLTNVILAGRATTVPFTTDASGHMRTPTDNPTAAMTCAVRRLARWRPRPIWLCKQGVNAPRGHVDPDDGA